MPETGRPSPPLDEPLSTDEKKPSAPRPFVTLNGRSVRLVPCRCPWCRKGLSRHSRVPMGHMWDGWEGHRPRISDADLAEWRTIALQNDQHRAVPDRYNPRDNHVCALDGEPWPCTAYRDAS